MIFGLLVCVRVYAADQTSEDVGKRRPTRTDGWMAKEMKKIKIVLYDPLQVVRMFTCLKESLAKLTPSWPFTVVKAEDELVDPQRVLRVCVTSLVLFFGKRLINNLFLQAKCEQQKEAQERFAKLQECNTRVTSKKNTAETCVEELWDFLEVVDKCVAKDLFDHLK